jgi:26S proteasome regulatory subunit N7
LIRELRVLVYSQFLESYKSVRLPSMATTFGVSVDFLDKCVWGGMSLQAS